ncbi:MAG TPA: four helix bundle protein [Chloroflexota bacterium]|nr:four helix bundle protein [Chloroflexota bacterium]
MSKAYSDLIVWQRAMDLVEEVYKATASFPHDERFGLSSQLRRAAVSVPSNIAEGQGRASPNEFLRHLSIARGSLCEVETQVLIAARLRYSGEAERDALLRLADEVGRLLRGLSKSLTAL